VDQSWFVPYRNAVMSYISLRRSIGAIGTALPFVLVLGTLAFSDGDLRSSMSGYYYTGMRDIFVGSMCAVGVFLVSYNFGRADNWLGNIAGVSAIGLAVFPTAPNSDPTGWQRTAGAVHLVFAAVFFLALAVFSLFLFTRTQPGADPTQRKEARNVVYRVCGSVILACLALAVIAGLVLGADIKVWLRPLLWLESIAVVAFGISWLVKGETLLRDPSPPRIEPGQPATAGADARS
jgi:hypothetical protein